ncbi:uncharacterized protein F4812DRAFT_467659 [Daldinia caldariorum]|uniref:uncharacterized protein n=1 Tax=Daldinia caldariorum TaxID=326644 RepID=UPI002007DB2E|nr:uncharacterized protein F4812DRAFT_467659 [Daldinia caldariorum]KAI1471654.1 hypothetical protein F4812DRAFT_467659 [Daldinia caldariorum]
MKYTREKPSATDNTFELLRLKVIIAIGTSKILRGGSRLLPQIAVGVTVLLFGSYLWSSHFASLALNSNYTKALKWQGDDPEGDIGEGLRIVVFGGGDVATPSRVSWQVNGPTLNCGTYHSFTPLADYDGGSIVSNSLFEAALDRTLSADNNTLSGLDYSWLALSYPAPAHQDLFHQIDDFLTSPLPLYPPRDTLWVFNIGYWDIWYLAALPRKLATHMVETQAQQVFSYIELLYEEAHKNNSIAFSESYIDTTKITPTRPTFRVFIPKPFSISLTSGFVNTRPIPPPPHTRAEQMRNAAFLENHWDKVFQDMLYEWERLPGREDVGDEDDLSEIKDADLLLSKKAPRASKPSIPSARREAITYDISSYLRDLIVERQLRHASIVDHDGVGSAAVADGYSEVWEPCIKRDNPSGDTSENAKDNPHDGWSVCSTPDEYLFWTDFTVSRQAVFEIGRRAAELLRRHVQTEAEWSRKGKQAPSSLRKDSNGAPLKAEGFET